MESVWDIELIWGFRSQFCDHQKGRHAPDGTKAKPTNGVRQGLNETATEHGTEGVGFKYLSNPIWWAGIATSGVPRWGLNIADRRYSGYWGSSELCSIRLCAGNSSYTSRGVECIDRVCLSMGISDGAYGIRAVLGAYFLNEELGRLGKLGCGICLIGSLIIVLHAPPDEEVQTVDEILHYAIKPGKAESSGCGEGLN